MPCEGAFQLSEVADDHEPHPPAYPIRPATIVEVKELPGGAVVYAVELDNGTRRHPNPETIHRPGEGTD